MKKKKKECLVLLLFTIYMALLVWIILFKLQFSISELDRIRSVNVIPFYYDNEVGISFHLKEVLENVVIFIPLGIYLCMFDNESDFKEKFTFILAVSLILEFLQYVLVIGRTDITDLITNTCGGIVGIIFYQLILKIFRNKSRINLILKVCATFFTVIVVGILLLFVISN